MSKNKRILVYFICALILGSLLCVCLYHSKKNSRKNGEKMYICVSGFEMEYEPKERNLSIIDFEKVDLGSSYDEIKNKFGEADGWIGGGILRPVYVLEDETAIVCTFWDSDRDEDLGRMEWFDGRGQSKIIKDNLGKR